jgi:predicted AlkP superfamily pyrophosphatase or phosphodiesterase
MAAMRLHFLFFFFAFLSAAAARPEPSAAPRRPRLVVGIVVDQMRFDFLERYRDVWGKGGFRRLLDQGFSFDQCHYSYFPTYTGPGHASIYTGTTPAVHGIAANEWFEVALGKPLYCTQDDAVAGVGTNGKAGRMSPANMRAWSVADRIRLDCGGKVFGLSMKDRGAILPAGHGADAAFWFEAASGRFVSSTWYRKLNGRLPAWMAAFNERNLSRAFLDSVWRPLLPENRYKASTADDVPWEKGLIPGRPPVFPYSLREAGKEGYEALRHSPFGNRLTTLAALACLEGEQLGRGAGTDVLALSYSCTDIVGHAYGPYARETQDTYVRLDRDLEELFTRLDQTIGRDQYLVFLSADHGILEVPEFLQAQGIPSFRFSGRAASDSLRAFCRREWGRDDLIRHFANLQVYLNHNLPGLSAETVAARMSAFLETLPGVQAVFSYRQPEQVQLIPLAARYMAGYHRGRSGDLQLVLRPGWLDSDEGMGTSHGSPYVYDSHVPCLWMGWQIRPGRSSEAIDIQDMAPTLSHMLGILAPAGCTGTARKIPLAP